MRRTTWVLFLLGATLGFFHGPRQLFAQACKDEEGMVADRKKAMSDLVVTVQKESLPDFQKAFHQKGTLTKLTLYSTMVDGLLSCLDKAAQDTTALKEQVDAYKAKREAYAKLKDKIQNERNALKSAGAPKDAKALIEKFDL